MKVLNYYTDYGWNNYLSEDGRKNVKKIGYDLKILYGAKVENIFELIPTDSRKSFYGKAKVIETEKGLYLLSYDTIVCALLEDTYFVKYWAGYSATTMRHINAFLDYIGWGMFGGKRFWSAIDCCRKYSYADLSI